MRKAAGFTLIELVIVIVILGILGAVAAPKFLNLQGDAYVANVKSLAGSLQSAATLANTKAILEGKDKGSVAANAIGGLAVTGYESVAFENGYPKADTVADGVPTGDGILGALQSVPNKADYNMSSTGGVLTIKPEARKAQADCYVTYTEATGTIPAKIDYKSDCK